jgi:hypothetical protein
MPPAVQIIRGDGLLCTRAAGSTRDKVDKLSQHKEGRRPISVRTYSPITATNDGQLATLRSVDPIPHPFSVLAQSGLDCGKYRDSDCVPKKQFNQELSDAFPNRPYVRDYPGDGCRRDRLRLGSASRDRQRQLRRLEVGHDKADADAAPWSDSATQSRWREDQAELL